jgi:hypothetical protein
MLDACACLYKFIGWMLGNGAHKLNGNTTEKRNSMHSLVNNLSEAFIASQVHLWRVGYKIITAAKIKTNPHLAGIERVKYIVIDHLGKTWLNPYAFSFTAYVYHFKRNKSNKSNINN